MQLDRSDFLLCFRAKRVKYQAYAYIVCTCNTSLESCQVLDMLVVGVRVLSFVFRKFLGQF
jgi:hypothetical protein